MADSEDFYEEDEPVEEIIAAFESGEKGLTVGTYEVVKPNSTFVGSATIMRDPFTPIFAVFSGNTVQASPTLVS